MPISMWRRVLALFLSVILVLQNLTCWMTPAWAEGLASTGEVVAAEQVDAADAADQPAASGDQGAAGTPASSGDDASNGTGDADNTGADANSAGDSAADAGLAGVSADAAGSQQVAQAPVALTGEEGAGSEETVATPRAYNPNAPFVPIDDSTSHGMQVQITYDGEKLWQGEAITPDTEMQGEITGSINEGVLTPETPRLSYVFPSNITVPNIGDTDLYDESGAYKATWSISNGVFYITYAEEWLQKHPSGITLGINFKMRLNPAGGYDADKVEVKFPGISTIVTFPLKDGNVSGNKWGTVDSQSNTVTWTVQLDVASKATNVVLTDTIGSNLMFDGATFKLDGTALTTPPTVNGQTATLNLGDLSQGRHTLTYTTPISPDAWKTVANGGQLSGVDNAASWTWGSNGENNKNNVGPTGPQLSINMAGKQGTGTSDDITWTASINTGSLKADMAGYVFTDTLGAGHTYKGNYEVKDASGATVATGALPTDGSSFSYTFGADAGKQTYTIVYHTQMTDAASKDPVNNKFTIENPNGGPKGDASSNFIPADDTQYITKRLVSSETAATDGYATWESTIFMSRMSASTDPATVTFTDEFNASQYQRTTFDQLKLMAGDYQLVEGVDYTVTNDGQWNTLEFTFMASDAVRALIGTADVTVTYRTKCDGSNDTYTNKSTLRTPTVTQSAEASFTIKADKTPEVAKNGNMSWDASFDWSKVEAGSTEKGAWVSNWTVLVNQVQPNGWTTAPAGPLGGVDVIVTDEMPENMVYVPGSSRYYLHGSDNSTIGHWPTLTAEPVCEGSTAVFTVKTDVEGVKTDVNYYVELQYQTAVHSSALGNSGTAVQFTNKAYAQAGTQTFPAGFKTVEGMNEIMKKSAEQVPNSSYIKYTISVNKNAVDLVPGAGTLTLVDTMDSKCTYLPATLHVYYQGTTTEVPGCSTLTENVTLDSGARATRLTLTIPDSCAIDVVYQVQPAGNPGDQVNLVNSVELSGVANSAISHQKQWTVVKAGANTEGTGYGITITKSDAANAKNVLGGATFELYQVAWNGSETLVGTQISNDNGVVQFGSKETPLLACTLYYFVETQAPAGYTCSSDKTYFMFKGTYSQEKYQEALDKAKAIGIVEPSPATSFNITNKKSDNPVVTGEFQLELAKTVNGGAPKAGETFEFSAASADEGAPVLPDVVTDEDGRAAFAAAQLGDKDAGKTYTYTIHELTGAAEGWTNAPDVIATVKVAAERDAQGNLAVEVAYSTGTDVARFDNAYQAKSAIATLAVDKVVNGEKNDAVDEAFTFELKAASADAPMPEGGATLAVTGTGTAQFGSIVFTKAGVYKYVIHETSDLGMGWANDADVNVTVEVTVDDATRDLVAKVDYDRAIADDSAAAFNDIHVADGKAVIAVSKTVNGSSTAKPNETFDFALYQADADGKATGEQLGRTVSVVTGGTASFDELTFNQVGTYVYVVREVGHDGNGWTAHDDVAVAVSVEKDPATNRLVATVNYGPGKSAAEFNDLYEATGSATLSVAKTVNGEAPQADQKFDFELRAVTEGAPMPENNTATTVGAALGSFGQIEFGLADAGKTYEYVIHEATPATAGWTMASDVTATVMVGADNGDGTLAPCAVTYSAATQDSQAALFNNVYRQVSGEFQLGLVKTVNGEAPKAGETFEFSATAEGNNAADAPAFGNVTTAEDGSASFAVAKLSDKDAGRTYTYRIHEATAAAQGWTNAPDVIATVTVGVPTDAGVLTADVTYRLDAEGSEAYAGAAQFDNLYQAKPARAALAVDKTVNGEKDESVTKQFTFALLDESGEQVGDEVTVGGTGAAEFGELVFDAPGAYRYTVQETSAAGAGWTNAADVEAVVTVGYAGNGRDLEVEAIEYSKGTDAAAFDNTYAATGEAVISVSKTVNGGTEAGQGESFTFGLYEADAQGNRIGEPFAYASTMVGGTASFDPISYNVDAAGKTFTYVVHETGHNANGWTAAPDVTVTVSVCDNGDGTLKCDVSYSRGTDAAAFDNTYVAATGEFQLELAKTVNGEAPKAGETFEFSAASADEGAPVLPDVVTDEDGRAAFAAAQLGDKDAGKTYTYTIHELTGAAEGWTNAPDVIATVKVAAERDAQGNLAVEVAYSTGTDVAQFDNLYQAKPARAALAVDKTVNGEKDESVTKQFTFALLDESGEQVGDEVTVGGTGAAEFGELVFDAPGAYRYTVQETSAAGAGWTNAADVEAVVTVGYAGNGRDLEVEAIEYSRGTDAAAFDNTYAATGSATLSVAKTVNGEAPAGDQGFDFELKPATEGAPMPEADVATTVGSARASFGQIEFGLADAGKTYEYVIHEATPATVGWTMAGDVTAIVTVGADRGDGTLAPCAVTYSAATADGAAALFDNAYEQASGEFQLAVSKTVNGAAPKAGESFEFSAASADEGAPAFENVTTSEDGSASFAVAKLSDKDAGRTYTYRIHEVTTAAQGWTNAPDVIATVTVGERSDENSLTASVSYRQDVDGVEPYAGAARFDNAYQVKPAVATLTVDKLVNGEKNASVAKQFTFELKAASENAPMPEGSALLSVTGTGTAQFGAITYDAAGAYAYVIREVSEEGAGWTNAPEVTVSVIVGAKGGEGTDRRDLEVKSVEYSNGADANGEAATFNNVYSASGEAVISVSKAVVGGTGATADEVFTFDLLDAEGNKLSTAEAKAGETASFKPIQYALADAGKTFDYTVREVGHNDKGWTADSEVSASVKVTDNLDGTLGTSVSYSRGTDSAEFTNVYAASAEAVFSVYKTVNGATVAKPGETFTFDLYKADESGAAVGSALGTVEAQMGQVSSFNSVRITSEGTYRFVIHETGHNADGWTAAPDVVVTVVATDNGDGTLKLEVTYSNESHGAAAFNDVYAAAGEAAIAVTKTVNGSTEAKPDETFTFDLLDAEGNVLSTAEAKVGQTSFFDRIAYTFDDAGKTFTYAVHETGHNDNGWAADSDVTATVRVSDNGNGTLKADIEYSRGTDAAAFDNTYAATGSAALSVAKTVNGEAPAGDQGFDFELKPATEGAPMPEADVATTVGSARASFGQIEFGLADAGKTYEYVIHEATPATVGWTMAGDVTAIVTVGADRGDGTLAPCAVTYSAATADGAAALFDNAYEQASGEFQLAVSKTVNGAAPKAGESFEFSAASADEGAPAFENVTTSEDGSASFAVAKLSDKDAGRTYTYTIHEVTELTEGAGSWTKAADVTATVVVSGRSDDNTLTATVSYADGSATAAKFDNTYEAQKATATVKVDKTVNGAKDAEEHAQFTFALLDKNNEQVGDEITVNGTGTAEFGELTFDAPGTYEFTVHETSDLGDGWFNAGDVKVTVTVDYAENGRDLVAKVTYGGSSIDAAQFDNVHAAPATADLKVTKTVNGGPLQPHEQFTFTLLDKDGNQLGGEITIKGSDAKPEAVFDQLAFDKVGTYEFTIHETSDLGDGWTNDGDVKVTVTVTRDEATKTLKAEVVYDRSDIDGNAAKFDNKHVACGSADIAVAKLVNGAAPAADQKFDFALSANDDASAAKMPAQTTATTAGSTVASFGSVDFTLADAGKTFSYTIHETTPAGEGWTNAPDVTVTLTVGDDNDGDGKLPVTVEYSTATADGTAALFNNAYKPVDPAKPSDPEKPADPAKPSVPKTGDETPVEAMALTAAAGTTLAATGLFLGLRSRKRDEQL